MEEVQEPLSCKAEELEGGVPEVEWGVDRHRGVEYKEIRGPGATGE